MIHLPELDALTAPYGALDVEPLTVTAHLVPGTHVVHFDPIHLDGLLAWCVVRAATDGWTIPPSNDNYWIPLPLRMLWQSPEGLPLWAASTFYPIGRAARDVDYYHKRTRLEFSDSNIRTNQGRWMERRNPVPTLLCDGLQARAIGHRETVAALLRDLAYIGKKHNLGYGEVAHWEVEPAQWCIEDIFVRDNTLIRPLPVAAESALEMARFQFPDAPSLAGWTPPHWHPALLRLCYVTGTRIKEVDYRPAP